MEINLCLNCMYDSQDLRILLLDHLHKTKKEYKSLRGYSRYIHQNKLYKACLQHDMAYGDFKGLTRRAHLIKYCIMKHLMLLKI